jgi:TPR repeat protein
MLILNGQGVPRDEQQAAILFRKSADQGYADAQNNLGVLYLRGQGVPQDYAQASAWFLKAAEQNEPHAEASLAAMYAKGQLGPADPAREYMWLNLASEKICAAKSYLDRISNQMTPEQIAKGQRLTREWLEAHPESAQ